MDSEFARRFASEWIEAWNSHDLEKILSHYADGFEMNSPMIAKIAGDPSCKLSGKNAVGAYWEKALKMLPDLHFKLKAVCVGVESIAVNYIGANGKLATEAFHFDSNGKVEKAFAHYEA